VSFNSPELTHTNTGVFSVEGVSTGGETWSK